MKLLSVSLLFAVLCTASPITFSDPWGQGSPDVIGDPARYDIQRIVVDVTATGVTADIYTNFGVGAGIAPYFHNGRWYDIGDLFFTVGGVLKYGVPLYEHAGGMNGGPRGAAVAAGIVYQILSPAGVTTAREAMLDYSGFQYRPEEAVLLMNNPGTLQEVAWGTVVVTAGRNAAHRITVSLVGTSGDFYADLAGASWGIHFASASCANDILDGQRDGQTPELGTLLLCGISLLTMSIRKKRRSS